MVIEVKKSPTICRLHAGEPGKPGYNSVQGQRPDTQGRQWVSPRDQKQVQCLKAGENQSPSSTNDWPFDCFFVPFGPSRDWTMPPQSESESLYFVY